MNEISHHVAVRARDQVAKSINTELIQTYWLIGQYDDVIKNVHEDSDILTFTERILYELNF